MLRTLFLNTRFFLVCIGLVLAFVLSFLLPSLLIFVKMATLLFGLLVMADILVLYRTPKGLDGRRDAPSRLSNGDNNEIFIQLENYYPFGVSVRVIDELPFQFQRRDVNFEAQIPAQQKVSIAYQLHPVKRGEYHFGGINVQVSSELGLVARRFVFSANQMLPVYPSYVQLRKYELSAINQHLKNLGIKKIRRVGNNQEFEQVKEYVAGDDVRTLNWKATARRNTLMVNHYQDEKSQQVYSLIDKGRVMRMPFEGMSLMDYAINAALVISNVAIRKDDKAGLITFNHRVGTVLKAAKTGGQMQAIVETLYNQKTSYKETDYEAMFVQVRKNITQRSLLLLYTNFESFSSMQRQLPYLRKLAVQHVLVVIFFENTELNKLTHAPANSTEEIYLKATAEKFSLEKHRIVAELRRHGIYAVLTSPDKLTINTINQYLELKARGLI